MDSILTEKLEVLLGERGSGSRPKAAVRRGDLSALQNLSMRSRALTAAPTMGDFNDLRADIERLMNAVVALSRSTR